MRAIPAPALIHKLLGTFPHGKEKRIMKKILTLAMCLLLLGACAAERPSVRKESVSTAPPDSILGKIHDAVLPDREPSAEDLLHVALTMLNNPDLTDHFVETKTILGRLIQSYPESKWRPAAESLLLFIDRQLACSEKIKGGRTLFDSVVAQKIKCEASDNQCRLEITRILQENEQLKKDLLNLKNLEIELEQRNRGLR
jgi:hypothetical protein